MSQVKSLISVLEKASKEKPKIPMRRFYFNRVEDVHDISGTGIVAEGVMFSDGSAVVKWLTETSSTTYFAKMEDVEKIHGHEGRTKIVWEDEMKKAQLIDLNSALNKAVAASEMSGAQFLTNEYSQDAMAAKTNGWTEYLRKELENFHIGDIPREIHLDEKNILVATQPDWGVYDGYVKNGDSNSGSFGEVLFFIKQMPLESMVQALRAKEFIRDLPLPPEPQIPQEPIPTPAVPESPMVNLLEALKTTHVAGDLNITIQKSENDPPMLDPMIMSQTAPDVVKKGLEDSTQDHYYVSFDGDNIGNKVALAEEKDDEEAIHSVSNKINRGQEVFKAWVILNGGFIIEAGGDEGLAKIPKGAAKEIEAFRKEYKEITGFGVTVGVGEKISHATKARMLGKLEGKDRIQWYDGDTKEQLKHKLKEADHGNEAKKLATAGFGKSAQANLLDALKKV